MAGLRLAAGGTIARRILSGRRTISSGGRPWLSRRRLSRRRLSWRCLSWRCLSWRCLSWRCLSWRCLSWRCLSRRLCWRSSRFAGGWCRRRVGRRQRRWILGETGTGDAKASEREQRCREMSSSTNHDGSSAKRWVRCHPKTSVTRDADHSYTSSDGAVGPGGAAAGGGAGGGAGGAAGGGGGGAGAGGAGGAGAGGRGRRRRGRRGRLRRCSRRGRRIWRYICYCRRGYGASALGATLGSAGGSMGGRDIAGAGAFGGLGGFGAGGPPIGLTMVEAAAGAVSSSPPALN